MAQGSFSKSPFTNLNAQTRTATVTRHVAPSPTPITLSMAGACAPAIPARYRSIHNTYKQGLQRTFDAALDTHAELLKSAFTAGYIKPDDALALMDTTRSFYERGQTLDAIVSGVATSVRDGIAQSLTALEERLVADGFPRSVVESLHDQSIELVKVFIDNGNLTLMIETSFEPIFFSSEKLPDELKEVFDALFTVVTYLSFGGLAYDELALVGTFNEPEDLTDQQAADFSRLYQAILASNSYNEEAVIAFYDFCDYVLADERLSATQLNIMENTMMFGALPFDTLNELTDALSEPDVFLANTDEDDLDSLNNAITRSIEFALARHELKPRFSSIETAVNFLDGFIPTTDIGFALKAIFTQINPINDFSINGDSRACDDWYHSSLVYFPCSYESLSHITQSVFNEVEHYAQEVCEYGDTYHVSLTDNKHIPFFTQQLENLYLMLLLVTYLDSLPMSSAK